MALRDEIDRVIAEEEKKAQRTRTQTTRRATRSRFEKPTYLAYYAAKLIFFFRRFSKSPVKKVAPDTNTPPAGHNPDRKKKKPTSFTGIMKEDIRNFMKRFSGEPKKKKPLPGSGESFDDWKDAFEKDGQAGVKEEDENVYTGGGGL
jgi:hypothetical protein